MPKSDSSPRRKKQPIQSNGSDTITIRTRHGTFSFCRRRFHHPKTQQSYQLPGFESSISAALQARCVDWATRFSFGEAAKLLQESCGQALLSEDGLWRLCQKEASRYDAAQGAAIAVVQQQSQHTLPFPCFRAVANVYATQEKQEKDAPEFLVLTDAICVPSQKPTRQQADQARESKLAKRHDTDVFVLPRRDGSEQFFCEGMSETWSCVSAVSAFLRQEWSGQQLSVVAITDGAAKIRADLATLFGKGVRVILDWYHLAKRVRENLSMAAHSRSERETWENEMLRFLWAGRVSQATTFLAGVVARNEKAKCALLGYLQKHAAEIIDYGRRQKAGKRIGSGRMEKAVDQVIGLRQKNRGMSWTKSGSRALALLTVAKLNARSGYRPCHLVTA